MCGSHVVKSNHFILYYVLCVYIILHFKFCSLSEKKGKGKHRELLCKDYAKLIPHR